MAKPRSPDNIITRLEAPELCKLFNEGGFTERIESGDLKLIVKKARITTMEQIRNWIPGTESQEIHLVDANNNLIVKAHRFLRPDGQLAASGMLDPKRIIIDGKIYALKSPDPDVRLEDSMS